MISKGKKRRFFTFFTIAISIFSIRNFQFGVEFLKDSYYQKSLGYNFKKSEVIKNNSTFFLVNRLKNSFVYDRKLRFYEYNGILKKIYNLDSRFMIDAERFKGFGFYKKFIKRKSYNYSSWKLSKPITIEVVNKNSENFSDYYFLKIFYYDLTKNNKMNDMIQDLILLTVKKK